jgi:ubiquinone biosynthesis protein UbiJ
LVIALWVSNERIVNLDAKVFTVSLEGAADKLGFIVSGTLNLQMIDLMNLTAGCLLILTTGVAFDHLINLSMAT